MKGSGTSHEWACGRHPLREVGLSKYSEEKPGTVPEKVSFQETSAKTDL